MIIVGEVKKFDCEICICYFDLFDPQGVLSVVSFNWIYLLPGIGVQSDTVKRS